MIQAAQKPEVVEQAVHAVALAVEIGGVECIKNNSFYSIKDKSLTCDLKTIKENYL